MKFKVGDEVSVINEGGDRYIGRCGKITRITGIDGVRIWIKSISEYLFFYESELRLKENNMIKQGTRVECRDSESEKWTDNDNFDKYYYVADISKMPQTSYNHIVIDEFECEEKFNFVRPLSTKTAEIQARLKSAKDKLKEANDEIDNAERELEGEQDEME